MEESSMRGMIKHLALPFLSVSLCLAQETAPEQEPTEAVQEPAVVQDDNAALEEEAEPYLEASRRHIELLRKLRDILREVSDRETADAAAAEVDALAQQVKAALEQEQSLAEPSQEVQYLVTAETAALDLEELAAESIGRAIEMQETEIPAYGSGAMEQALNALLSLYLQEEDEE